MLLSLGQSSAPNCARTEEELSFLHAIEFSDVPSVRVLLLDNPSLNVDVIDALGRSALRLAVRNENRELVEVLLELCNNENIHQAALQAIGENKTTIAELILKHPSYLRICQKRKRLGDTDGFFKIEVESQFSTDITPLNLAAQKNNFDIVKLLLQRGETIPKPDKFDCGCTECRNRMKFDQLRMANFRLNSYRGLASEAYVALSSDDPILTAFELAKELRNLSKKEKHFKKEYKDLANQLSNFVVELLDRVWTQKELEMVLNKTGSANSDKYENLARLKMALENKEKKFVAHPSVQQHLVKIWHHGLQTLETMHPMRRLLALPGIAIVSPYVAIARLFRPQWKWTKLAKQPMVKFLGHTLSYFIFLLLIIIFSWQGSVSNKITLYTQYPNISAEYRKYRAELGKQVVPYGYDFPLRPHDTTVTECVLSVWIVGMVIQEVQQVSQAGAQAHFNDLFNVLDFFLLVAYVAVLVLSHWILSMSTAAIEELQGKNVTQLLETPSETNHHLYWLNCDRLYWTYTDPYNFAEGLFAMANIVSFARIFYLLRANETLGPMQISLGRMINDIIKVLVFGMLAVAGFIVSLRNLFWWYSETLSRSGESLVNVTNAATSFLNIRKQFITVFWWIYGRGPMNQALDIPSKYKNGDITEVVGHILAALYHIAIIIVLVNLLIAMMARSFEKIQADVDAEWKYARSLLYMEYIDENCTPPVPINVLLPFRDAVLACVDFFRNFKKEEEDPPLSALVSKQRRKACYSGGRINGVSERGSSGQSRQSRLIGSSTDDQPSYKDIAQTIVQRYIFDIQREEEFNKGKLEEARQNICQIKWELMDLMNERDIKTSRLNTCMKAITSEVSTLVPTPSMRRRSSSTTVRRRHSDGRKEVGEGDGREKEKAVEYPKTISSSGV